MSKVTYHLSMIRTLIYFLLALCLSRAFASDTPPGMQKIEALRNAPFYLDLTEVTIGQMQAFAVATGFISRAEKNGGGVTYESGWEQRKGWTWRAPFGTPGQDNEPAVHLDFDEAAGFCRWAGKRLPSDAEWGEAAYTERRKLATDGFITGKSYAFPTGDSPLGANCLGDCGTTKPVSNAVTSRGKGHATAGSTKRGVNGLYDMGGNAWEWVESGAKDANEKRTRGGSWWYGSGPMKDDHQQSKPRTMSAVYIGFRCAK